MQLTPYQTFEAVDIEGDNLYYKIKRMWCSVNTDIDSGCVVLKTRPDTVEELGQRLLYCRDNNIVVVGHNVVDFDFPAIEKLLGISLEGLAFVDTLVVSRAILPDREGGHSLKMWGKRLGILKGTYGEDEGEDAWDKFSEDMLEYCQQDVEVTIALFKELMRLIGLPREEWYKVVQIYNSPEVVNV